MNVDKETNESYLWVDMKEVMSLMINERRISWAIQRAKSDEKIKARNQYPLMDGKQIIQAIFNAVSKYDNGTLTTSKTLNW